MPRGVKRVVDYNEQLRIFDEQIAALRAQREDLIGCRRAANLEALEVFMQQNNLPAIDVVEHLTAAIAASAESGAKKI